MSMRAAPRTAPPAPKGRPRRGELRPDRRNTNLGGPAYRRLLAQELPELPREIVDKADVLTLAFLAAQLMGPQEDRDQDQDQDQDQEHDDAVPPAAR